MEQTSIQPKMKPTNCQTSIFGCLIAAIAAITCLVMEMCMSMQSLCQASQFYETVIFLSASASLAKVNMLFLCLYKMKSVR